MNDLINNLVAICTSILAHGPHPGHEWEVGLASMVLILIGRKWMKEQFGEDGLHYEDA
jgi:hypothetical protein